MELDLPPLKPGEVNKGWIALEGAFETDVVTAGLSSLGEALVFVTARVASKGRVLVLFRNEGESKVDVEKGTLRVVASSFG